jgi:hypothetical protein
MPWTAVRVWEEHVAEGIEALAWMLRGDEQRAPCEAARERALHYATRWGIADHHQARTTGMGWDGRERVRMASDAPAASAGWEPLALKVLRWQSLHPIHPVGEVALAMGRVGGQMHRKRDGLPGWITWWRGLSSTLSIHAA